MSRTLILCIALCALSATAQAALRVHPTIVIIGDKSRSTTIQIRESGNEVQTYRLQVVYNRMLEDGRLQALPPDQHPKDSAYRKFRFSPKKVTLVPGQDQTIRLLSKNISRFPDGEYRAHLKFVPEDSALGESEQGAKKGVSISIKTRIVVSIPVIVQKGKIEESVRIDQLRVFQGEQGEWRYSAMLNKQGNSFPRGELSLYRGSNRGDRVAYVTGLSSYIDSRPVSFAFDKKFQSSTPKGTYVLEYRSLKPYNKGEVLHSRSIQIP